MAQNVICLGECSMWAWEKCFSTAIAVVGWNILDMSMRSSWLTGLLSSTVSLWILCLLDLLITEKRMLMTWIIIVAMYIFLSVLLAFLSSNLIFFFFGGSVQSSRSVVSDYDPMDCSMPGLLPVHHQLLEFTQIHVHWVGDAIQPSHPLSSPSPPIFNLS